MKCLRNGNDNVHMNLCVKVNNCNRRSQHIFLINEQTSGR